MCNVALDLSDLPPDRPQPKYIYGSDRPTYRKGKRLYYFHCKRCHIDFASILKCPLRCNGCKTYCWSVAYKNPTESNVNKALACVACAPLYVQRLRAKQTFTKPDVTPKPPVSRPRAAQPKRGSMIGELPSPAVKATADIFNVPEKKKLPKDLTKTFQFGRKPRR